MLIMSTHSNGHDGSYFIDVRNLREMTLAPLGGGNGNKYYIFSGEERFIAKEIRLPLSITEPSLNQLVAFYEELYSRGYCVPEKVTYCSYGENSYLIMSDMSENGKFLLWGINDLPHEEEIHQLREMQLTMEDIEIIRAQLAQWLSKAAAEGVYIGESCYHLRKNRQTGSIDIVFLFKDSQNIIPLKNEEINRNNAEAESFLKQLMESANLK